MALPDPDIVQPADAPSITPQEGTPESAFFPHAGDHGGGLFNHPSTNRGASPGIYRGEPVRAPEGGMNPSGGRYSGSLAPRRRIDITMPPPNLGPTGSPRRAGGRTY